MILLNRTDSDNEKTRRKGAFCGDGVICGGCGGLVEDVAEAAEDSVFDGFGGLHAGLIAELFDVGFFLFAELFGDVDHYVDELVALGTAGSRGESFATESEDLAGLCSGLDFQSGATGDGRNFD